MDLLQVYTFYIEESTDYIGWIETLVNEDFQSDAAPIIKIRLSDAKAQFEKAMEQCSTLEVEAKDENNLKDLRYLIMDSIFLASDLVRFYEAGDLGRFKMRVLNFLNKKRRAELFGETQQGSCRVMQ